LLETPFYMGGASTLGRVSIDPEISGYSGKPELWPTLAKMSRAPI